MIHAAWYSDVPFGTRFTTFRLACSSPAMQTDVLHYAAFTPDTCSPDTSSIHLYPLLPSTGILYRQQNCPHGYLYSRVEHCLELVSVDM